MIEVYKKFFLFLGLTILLCLSASIVWSETMEDLIWRDGNYYKKFSDVPFNGKVNGDIKGLIKNGKKEGTWVRYYENGQLFSVSNYNIGRKDGAWITYNNKGMLIEKGKYKNDLEEGPWIRFYENGEINYKGDFVSGKKVGLWIAYYYNGQLEYKGNFDNGKKSGLWEYYSVSGNILEEHSGIYKNDKKVSSKT
jgi:antitoxin component YwqK of YwqJK toxin-antitoxin module